MFQRQESEELRSVNFFKEHYVIPLIEIKLFEFVCLVIVCILTTVS